MLQSSTASFDAEPARVRDPAAPIKLALALAALAAVGLLAWNVLAVLV